MTGTGKGERTRARLLEIAVRRFALDGYRQTSVAAVARDAQLTPAAVYAYFNSKERLFEAAVDADAASLIGEAVDALGGQGLRSGYPSLLTLLIDNLVDHPLARRVLAGKEPEVIDRLLSLPALLEMRSLVATWLAEGQEAGTVRTDIDPKVMSMGLETMTLSLLIANLQVQEVDEERAAGIGAILAAAIEPVAPSG